MEFEDTRFYRVAAVADALDVHRATIYRAIESGALDAVRIGAGKGALRVTGQAVGVYLEACSEAAYEAHVVRGESAEAADVADVAAGAPAGEVA